MKNHCALVLGGYINGYSIIKELHEKKVKKIALIDYGNSIASHSNKICYYDIIDKTSESLKKALVKLHKKFDFIVIFPTDDLQIENLYNIYQEISAFCFIPFNYTNILDCLDKFVQYQYCKKLVIPYPKTALIKNLGDIEKISHIKFPVIIKPNKREDLKIDIFRSLILNSYEEYKNDISNTENFVKKGVTFLVSEVIPGDGSNIYAYVGYRDRQGNILNEWTGRKLSQYPDDFGVFSSASNEAPVKVMEYGRKLFHGMGIMGIAEPEFKYDNRDGKYKLMEINFRSMMWHRIGNLTGVNIQYSQYLDAINESVAKQKQYKGEPIHFVYMKHEILNLFSRKGYWKNFIHNILGTSDKFFAVYDSKDMRPCFYDLIALVRELLGRCLRVLKIR